ncbi:hypothetical protein [Bacillus cereus]|uniref:Uncharacterized protein n=2 Tax=Bacillus cereus group TaxID=86661 RepID=A0A9W3PU54_9BACI|nr:hypothetical protein [Bacillus cereus]AHX21780.1 hypothetical protein CY96_28760 [Bacillus bombysepticus str. Wang]MDC7729844.1 hypothetical protein [Bacillus cereus]WCT66883.1 hypothetical protein PRK74_27245 [Bacillus cereus]
MHYLECLLRVFQKIDVQIGYNLYRWTPIYTVNKKMKGFIILQKRRMYKRCVLKYYVYMLPVSYFYGILIASEKVKNNSLEFWVIRSINVLNVL